MRHASVVDERLLQIAEDTKGFLPRNEGLALHGAGVYAAPLGPLLEIGSYCGKSTVYLGAAAYEHGTVLYSIDHHRGSEEHQPGEGYHDPVLFDENEKRIDTLPHLLATIARAGLIDVVAPLVGRSSTIAAAWTPPLGLVFIDGGHSESAAQADFEGWSSHIVAGGLLVIHDVFDDAAEGGRAPFNVYRRALDSERFADRAREGSLRVLERVGDRV